MWKYENLHSSFVTAGVKCLEVVEKRVYYNTLKERKEKAGPKWLLNEVLVSVMNYFGELHLSLWLSWFLWFRPAVLWPECWSLPA